MQRLWIKIWRKTVVALEAFFSPPEIGQMSKDSSHQFENVSNIKKCVRNNDRDGSRSKIQTWLDGDGVGGVWVGAGTFLVWSSLPGIFSTTDRSNLRCFWSRLNAFVLAPDIEHVCVGQSQLHTQLINTCPLDLAAEHLPNTWHIFLGLPVTRAEHDLYTDRPTYFLMLQSR